ncbi:unnamed protein product [Aphanomyces euteiches]|uniref:Complex 1 LYR protein domain-containing protein n=1 Tax=Aphanomyces euteiches TaxID=100861 RepID=A0A6G0WNE4_9STRA|nr:hypothetical protein Ae201684_013413 [Aphanomyces euteiches]KAH9062908.1 hypothetical protein Ae201684P_009174 [Aphanomyces euteiches]
MPPRPVWRLYRRVCRVALDFPPLMAKKIRYNARELIRLRRHEEDSATIARYLQQGHEDVETLKLLVETPGMLDAIGRKQK